MVGKSMLDFIHPDDHKELAKQFMVSVPGQQTFKGYGMEGTKDRPTAMSVNFFNQTGTFYKRLRQSRITLHYWKDLHAAVPKTGDHLQ